MNKDAREQKARQTFRRADKDAWTHTEAANEASFREFEDGKKTYAEHQATRGENRELYETERARALATYHATMTMIEKAPELIKTGTLNPGNDDYPSATRFWAFAPGTTIERAMEILEILGYDPDGYQPRQDYSPTGQWFTYGINHHTFDSGRLIVTQYSQLDI